MKFEIHQGDAVSCLSELDSNSIQTTVTSPPYFRLRNYSEGHPSEIGRKKSVADYISNLVEVFLVVREKTKDDGSLFLNLGDSYINGHLAGVPWRVAIALTDSGWILRSDIIWRKPNAMPSSVKNRPTTDHEYIFMFAKSKKYFYVQDAIREPHVTFSSESKMRGGRAHLGKRGGVILPQNHSN